jgi:hypothetical protein
LSAWNWSKCKGWECVEFSSDWICLLVLSPCYNIVWRKLKTKYQCCLVLAFSCLQIMVLKAQDHLETTSPDNKVSPWLQNLILLVLYVISVPYTDQDISSNCTMKDNWGADLGFQIPVMIFDSYFAQFCCNCRFQKADIGQTKNGKDSERL